MTTDTLFVILCISCLLCGVIAMICAHTSRQGLAFLLGLLFGPLGILIAAVLRPAEATAPPQIQGTPARPAALPELPDLFEIRRGYGAGAEHYGPYTLDDVLTHLAEGTLLPTDQYRTSAGHWALLSRTGLF